MRSLLAINVILHTYNSEKKIRVFIVLPTYLNSPLKMCRVCCTLVHMCVLHGQKWTAFIQAWVWAVQGLYYT